MLNLKKKKTLNGGVNQLTFLYYCLAICNPKGCAVLKLYVRSKTNICPRRVLAQRPKPAKTRGGIIGSPAYTYKECLNIGVVCESIPI